MAEATNPADAQMQALSAMMGPMLMMMVVMLALMFFPFIRIALSFSAGSIIEPALPFHNQYFVPTVFVVGSSIMVVNTIIRSFFVDSMKNRIQKKQSIFFWFRQKGNSPLKPPPIFLDLATFH